MIWKTLDAAALGYIPTFFSEHDPRPAREQLHENYAHGGGVTPFEGFTLHIGEKGRLELHYPGDPPTREIGWTMLREEHIVVFEYAWVMIGQKDGSCIITRCD